MRTLVTILGMHRSGTSAVAGMISEHGISLGPVSEQNKFNPRGNREIRELNRLHDRILEGSGGSWSRPSANPAFSEAETAERDEILATIPGDVIGVKDPRLLLLLDFWRDLEPRPIGVIRNPVDVTASLLRRAKNRPEKHPQLTPNEWEELWRHYNRVLLAEFERKAFPIINFDQREELDGQIQTALRAHRLVPGEPSTFFEEGFVTDGGEDWKARITASETLELWDELAARCVEP